MNANLRVQHVTVMPTLQTAQRAKVTRGDSPDRHRRHHRGLRAVHRPRGQRPRLRLPRRLRRHRILLSALQADHARDDCRAGRHRGVDGGESGCAGRPRDR